MDPRKIYVGSLPDRVDDGALRAIFEAHGAIESAQVVRHPDGTPRGFGFVKFADQDAAQRAVAGMNGASVEGRRIRVSVAGEKSAAAQTGTPGMGGRPAGQPVGHGGTR